MSSQSPEKLTDRQQEVFDFIRREILENQRPPTIRAIAAHFGIKSPNGIAYHIHALQMKGYLRRESGAIARGIRLSDAAFPGWKDAPKMPGTYVTDDGDGMQLVPYTMADIERFQRQMLSGSFYGPIPVRGN